MARVKQFNPSEADIFQSVEGYFHYLTGATILHDPEGMYEVHRRDVLNPDDIEPIITTAQSMMLRGIKTVIAMANHPDYRRPQRQMADKFERALGNMQHAITRAYEEYPERAVGMSEALEIVRPSPMLNRAIYTMLCAGAAYKVPVLRLMDTLPADPSMLPYLIDRRSTETGHTKKAA